MQGFNKGKEILFFTINVALNWVTADVFTKHFFIMKATKSSAFVISLKMNETHLQGHLKQCVHVGVSVYECVCGLCDCTGPPVQPISIFAFSCHTLPSGYPAHRAKIKTSPSSLFIKNNRLWLLSLLSSSSLPLPLAASSSSLLSSSIGDQ